MASRRQLLAKSIHDQAKLIAHAGEAIPLLVIDSGSPIEVSAGPKGRTSNFELLAQEREWTLEVTCASVDWHIAGGGVDVQKKEGKPAVLKDERGDWPCRVRSAADDGWLVVFELVGDNQR